MHPPATIADQREGEFMGVNSTYYQRSNGDDADIEIEVEFTLSGGHDGSPPSLSDPGEPGEPPEFELQGARIVGTDEATELTPEEEEAVRNDVYDRLGDFMDSDDYFEDY
jgi:hypothetical protein